MAKQKFCYSCSKRLRSKVAFCQQCGTQAVELEVPGLWGANGASNSNRNRPARTLVPLFIIIAFVAGAYIVPWVQDSAALLDSDEVKVELQVGHGSANWLKTNSYFRAKVSLPHKLSDSATVKLERMDDGIWVKEDSKETSGSGTIQMAYYFKDTEETQVRVALYSGDRLIQTSNVKTVQGVNQPKGWTGTQANVYFRPFTQKELRSVSRPNCGSYCWSYWVSTPIKSRLTLWMQDGGVVLTSAVSVTITQAGVFQKVIIPGAEYASGALRLNSRPATSSEIRAALSEKERQLTQNAAKERARSAACSSLSDLLQLRDTLSSEYRVLAESGESDYYSNLKYRMSQQGARSAWQRDLAKARKKLEKLKADINRCFPSANY